jgi:hypothetical protein
VCRVLCAACVCVRAAARRAPGGSNRLLFVFFFFLRPRDAVAAGAA